MKMKTVWSAMSVLLVMAVCICCLSVSAEEGAYIENEWNYVDQSMDVSHGIPDDAAGVLDRIRREGVLRIATEPYFAPQEFIDPDLEGQDQYVGADMKLAALIAERMGVGLEIVFVDQLHDLRPLFLADAGGAPILGLKGAVLKIHGNSKETEVYYAIHRAIDYVNNDITGMIEEAILKYETIRKEHSLSGRIAEAISNASESWRRKPDADKSHDDASEEDPYAVFMKVDEIESEEEQ